MSKAVVLLSRNVDLFFQDSLMNRKLKEQHLFEQNFFVTMSIFAANLIASFSMPIPMPFMVISTISDKTHFSIAHKWPEVSWLVC